MNDSLEALQGEVLDRIQQSASEAEIEQLRVEVLGRNGRLTLLLRGLKDLPVEERRRAGEQLNQLKREIEGRLDARLAAVKAESKSQALKERENRHHASREPLRARWITSAHVGDRTRLSIFFTAWVSRSPAAPTSRTITTILKR